MKEPRIHVVSFQTPWPADYGGAIDVWYKLLALRRCGWRVALHTFVYGARTLAPELREAADEVYAYRRTPLPGPLLSLTPMIVKSRADRGLLSRLAAVDPSEPIVFEGLHTTAWLSSPLLRDRIKIVRAHNVEHDYYRLLADSCRSPLRKGFFLSESMKLRAYEKVLRHASAVLAISEGDLAYFRDRYPEVRSELVPCFYDQPDTSGPLPEDEAQEPPYLFYNGNLAVAENVGAALYIMREVVPLLPADLRVVIAGKDPSTEIIRAAASSGNVEVIANPSEERMQRLMRQASVSLLVTSQPTGIKLKLLNTLYATRGHVVANSMMLNDSVLRRICRLADTPRAQAEAIAGLVDNPPSSAMLRERREVLLSRFDNTRSAGIITDIARGFGAGAPESPVTGKTSNLIIS